MTDTEHSTTSSSNELVVTVFLFVVSYNTFLETFVFVDLLIAMLFNHKTLNEPYGL